jgi:hypothetical protein
MKTLIEVEAFDGQDSLYYHLGISYKVEITRLDIFIKSVLRDVLEIIKEKGKSIYINQDDNTQCKYNVYFIKNNNYIIIYQYDVLN